MWSTSAVFKALHWIPMLQMKNPQHFHRTPQLMLLSFDNFFTHSNKWQCYFSVGCGFYRCSSKGSCHLKYIVWWLVEHFNSHHHHLLKDGIWADRSHAWSDVWLQLYILMIITTITSLGLALGQIIDSRQREGERTVAKWVCLAPGEVFFFILFMNVLYQTWWICRRDSQFRPDCTLWRSRCQR